MNKEKRICFFLVVIIVFSGLLKVNCIYATPIITGSGDKLELDFKKNRKPIDKLQNKKIEKKKINNMGIRSERGITNILLVGVDNRESRRDGRSDAMMILTLDQNKNNMKITSLMRDTYVYIEGHGKEKLNHSYAYGGIKLLRQTVENTFKVKMDHYVIVDFEDFEEIVDILGGVEVYVDEEEIGWIKKRFKSENKKMRELGEPGEMTLNGKEALAYSRIRFTSSGSYGRTERHREVLSSIKNKMSKLSFFKYPKLIGTAFKSVTTDMKLGDIFDYGYWYNMNSHMDMETLQIPTTKLSEGVLLNKEKGWVLKMDELKNIKVLEEFIFHTK